MLKCKSLFFIYFCVFGTCMGAIWKTEDAYIIDDLPEDDSEVSTTGQSNVCVDSYGAAGQCVLLNECSGNYAFFESLKSVPATQEGLFQYLNTTDLEPCTPSNQVTPSNTDATTTPPFYVCCTSYKYANVKEISLNDYKEKEPTQILEPVTELEMAESPILEELITHGTEARQGEYPFAVAIIYKGQQICGGSLIDSLWVVSAAHCFDRFNSQAVRQLVIKIGDHNIASASETHHQDKLVAKLFLHPGFFRDRGYFRDDIALIKLKSPVSSSGNVRAIALHNGSPNINVAHVQATVCGWGKTCDGAYCPQSSVLRKTNVNLVSMTDCSRRYAGTQAPSITQKMVCAGGEGTSSDACNGDSGGPLFIYSGGQVQQIGIVSWGIGCGKYPGVYTRVSSFVNWVIKHKQK